MLDDEEPGLTVDDCVRWCDRVEAHTGRPAVVYVGRYTAGGALWSSPRIFNGQRARIFPAYTTEAKATAIAAPYGWDAWQWTEKGSVAGIGPLVDLDQVDDPSAFDRCCQPTVVSAATCLFGYPCPWAK
jgi:GH25 family lysozyme M1 (1,4-beta-N-acetylmuramidase)